MNNEIKQFLASGKLEEYLMGLTDDADTQEVEFFIRKHPEVKELYEQLQTEIDEYADKYPIPPSRSLRNEILSELNGKSPTSKMDRSRFTQLLGWTTTLFVLAGAFIWGIDKNEKIIELQDRVHALEHSYEDSHSEFVELNRNFSSLSHPYAQKLHLFGNEKSKKMCMVAYWNPEKKSSHIHINKAPKVDKHCYQLWADINGEMRSMGVIDCKNTINKMPYWDGVESLNITLEPEGGSEEPTLANLVASVEIRH